MKCTKRGPGPPLLRKKGAPAILLRGSRQSFDTENTTKFSFGIGIYISSLGSYLLVKYVSSGMMNEWKSRFGAVGGWTNVCIPFLIRLLNA